MPKLVSYANPLIVLATLIAFRLRIPSHQPQNIAPPAKPSNHDDDKKPMSEPPDGFQTIAVNQFIRNPLWQAPQRFAVQLFLQLILTHPLPHLTAMAQHMICQRHGHHRFGDGDAANADAGIMAAFCSHVDFIAFGVNAFDFCQH